MFEVLEEYPVTAICFLVVIFCLVYTWKLKKDFFHPTVIYLFTQCLTLGIAYLKLSPLMTDFLPETWLVWGGAMFSFILGSALYYILSYKGRIAEPISVEKPLEDYSWKMHFAFSVFLLLFFLTGVAGIVSVVGTLIFFSDSPGQWVSADVNYGYWPVLESTAPLVVVYFTIASLKKLNPYKWIRVVSRIFALLTPIMAFLCYPNRSTLFLCIGWALILFNYVGKKIHVKYIVLVMLIATAFFVFVALLRAQYGTNSIEGMAARQVMLMPYKYVANNYWNLDYAINPPVDRERHPSTYGVDAIYGIFEYTVFPVSIRNMMHWDDMFNKSIQKEYGLNTTGYLWEVYKDWGIAGTVLFPFVVSFFLTYLYEKMKRSLSPRLWILQSLFVYYIGWWWFVEGYKRGLFWLWIYMILVFTKLCERKTKKLKENASQELFCEK